MRMWQPPDSGTHQQVLKMPVFFVMHYCFKIYVKKKLNHYMLRRNVQTTFSLEESDFPPVSERCGLNFTTRLRYIV